MNSTSVENPLAFFKLACRERLAARHRDRSEVEDTTAKLYELIGKGRPWVVCLDGPFQLCLVPPLLIKILRSDQFLRIVNECSGGSISLEDHWMDSWPDLWNDVGLKLLEARLEPDNKEEWRLSSTPFATGGISHEELENMKLLITEKIKQEIGDRLKQADQNFWITVREQLEAAHKRIISPNQPASLADDLNLWPHLVHNSIFNLVRQLRPSWIPTVYAGNVTKISDPKIPIELRSLMLAQQRLETFYHNLIAGVERHLENLPGVLPRRPEMLWTGWSGEWITTQRYLLQLPSVPPDVLVVQRVDQLGTIERFANAVFGSVLSDGIAFVCDWPQRVTLDDRNRYHSTDGPALKFADGFSMYRQHGVHVARELIERPHDISVDMIENQISVERRRVMIELYGAARYLRDSGAVLVNEDETGALYRKELLYDEPMQMVKVVNSTPEPDGTFREYFLRVPPTVRTAREAVAWTFATDESEYSPQFET